jgi:hypothetical protein
MCSRDSAALSASSVTAAQRVEWVLSYLRRFWHFISSSPAPCRLLQFDMLVENIIIRVIGLLYEDLRAHGNLQDLRTCALVHRTFTRTCQRHLFRTIRLGKDSVARRLQSVLQQSPVLALHVQEVALDLWMGPDPTLWPVILRQLRNTTFLDVIGPPSRSTTEHGVSQAIAAISFLPSIEILGFTRLTLVALEQLVLTLCANTSIRHVNLFECALLDSETELPSVWQPLYKLARPMDVRLESIEVTSPDRNDLSRAFMSWLAITSSRTTLRRVSLWPTDWSVVSQSNSGLSLPLASFSGLRCLHLDCRHIRSLISGFREQYDRYAPSIAEAGKQLLPGCLHTQP